MKLSSIILFIFHFIFRNIRPYKGLDDLECQKGGTFFSMNMLVKKGGAEADKAMKMEIDDRLKLVVKLLPSDDEDDMDLDRKYGSLPLVRPPQKVA